jgi:hypothetical protein
LWEEDVIRAGVTKAFVNDESSDPVFPFVIIASQAVKKLASDIPVSKKREGI